MNHTTETLEPVEAELGRVPNLSAPAATLLSELTSIKSDSLSFADLVRILKKRYLVMIATAAVAIAIAIAYVQSVTPIYQAAGTIEIDPSRGGTVGLDDIVQSKLGSGSDASIDLKTQVEILKSNAVALGVLKDLNAQQLANLSGGQDIDGTS